MVYRAKEMRIEPERCVELAGHFNLRGKVHADEELYCVGEDRRLLALYRNSGAFWYADFDKLNNPAYKADLFNKGDAPRRAIQFLQEHAWLPEETILDSTYRAPMERVDGRRRRRRTACMNHCCVEFRAAYDRLHSYGPGGKIKVYLGDEGEIIGLFHSLRPVAEFGSYRLHSAGKVARLLFKKLGAPSAGIQIRELRLAYHTESPTMPGGFAHPVYVFTLAAPVPSRGRKRSRMVEFVTHPMPATTFHPIVTIDAPSRALSIHQGERLTLSADITGGTPPFTVSWDSNVDGHLSDAPFLVTNKLSVASQRDRITSHTIKVTVFDSHGLRDSHQILVTVHPQGPLPAAEPRRTVPDDVGDPYVGVEWCNIYHGTPGLADISGTDESARGFRQEMERLSNWSSRFDWGNDAAWEQDFKFSTAPGGGTDYRWVDNVHFAFFAGHGSPGAFYFGSTVDDHEMRAQDAQWGDGRCNWIVLHACQTMRANFGWTVWCNAFRGLHQMLGFHTNTEGSIPALGTRLAFWMSFVLPFWGQAFDIRAAWQLACMECFDSSMEYAVIYAGQSGTDTHNDHLPGYGPVSPDPTSPNYWVYYRGSC
jgi:hypothetical protein